ncbi:MAG TPA: hypothetical protein DD670_00695, partial [Planctomycetaceae bacterium]|nr:hypothetical protein [Planctomycetaceae bacterium]
MNLDLPVAWQFATMTDLARSVVGDAARWLTDDERKTQAALRAADYRRQWTAGRVLAKRLMLEQGGLPARDARAINITSRSAHGFGIRPRVTIDGDVVPCSLSISHTDGAVLAAFTTLSAISVGVDLVERQPFAPGFSRRWFTGSERELVAAGEDDELEIGRIWAMKEAIYKAACHDEPFAPRRIRLEPIAEGYTCVYRGLDLANRCRIQTWLCENYLCAEAVINGETSGCEPRPALTGGPVGTRRRADKDNGIRNNG